ncbi:MAG: hypothetical protein ACI87N_003310, partial [Flavobacteriales bacterium]
KIEYAEFRKRFEIRCEHNRFSKALILTGKEKHIHEKLILNLVKLFLILIIIIELFLILGLFSEEKARLEFF